MVCASAWLQAMTAQADARTILVVDEAWAILTELAVARYLRSSWKLARSYGLANVAVCHRASDLGASGPAGSEQSRLAEGLLADSETVVCYAQPRLGTARAGRPARVLARRARRASAAAPGRGAVAGRKSPLPRRASPRPGRARRSWTPMRGCSTGTGRESSPGAGGQLRARPARPSRPRLAGACRRGRFPVSVVADLARRRAAHSRQERSVARGTGRRRAEASHQARRPPVHASSGLAAVDQAQPSRSGAHRCRARRPRRPCSRLSRGDLVAGVAP